MSDPKIEEFSRVPLFADAGNKQLEQIARLCTEISVPDGRVLCKEGDLGQEFFIILEGQVKVSTGGREVATLQPGEFFGELALLDGGGRNATVVADGPVRLLVLTHSEFRDVLDEDPGVAVRMLPAIGARLRAGAAAAQEQPPVV